MEHFTVMHNLKNSLIKKPEVHTQSEVLEQMGSAS